MTPAEIKSQIAALVPNFFGGFIESRIKSVLNNIVDNMGSAGASLLITEVPKTASFSISDTDKFCLYVINSSSAVVVTFPTALTAGNWWEVVSVGTGAVSFIAGSSATIVSPDSRLKLRTQYSQARIIARASNQGVLGGDIVL